MPTGDSPTIKVKEQRLGDGSMQENPHYYMTVDIDMSKTLKLREVFNQTLMQKDPSAKLSVNDFIVKAVACALSDVPEVNSA